MGLRISTAARNAVGDTVRALLGAGGPGRIDVRTGGQPAGPDASATGTLLVTFELSPDAYADFDGGTAELNPVADADAVATGTAGWFRMSDADGAGVIDGPAGTSGTMLLLNATDIVAGGTVSIISGSLTMPTGV